MFKTITICVFLTAFSLWARAADTNSLVWHRATDRVDADVRGMALWPLLEKIAVAAGWHIFVEPDTTHITSAKFKDLPSGDALKMLLGNLNFALVPRTNGAPQLYVFRTALKNATQPVLAPTAVPRHVPNELLVKLKPGTDADAMAKLLGAKIIGRNDKLGLYRLQFANADATDAALASLKNNPDVEAVDYNYVLDPPATPQLFANPPVGPVSLTLDPATTGDPCNPVVGLIDTGVQSLGSQLDPFMLKPISVAGDACPGTSDITHGTAMAETILRAVSQSSGGKQPVRILSVNVYGCADATTTTWNVALGIQAAVDNGATVLNLSLGGSGDSAVLDSVIQQAIAAGIPIYAAAGNQPVSTPDVSGGGHRRHCRDGNGRRPACAVCELRQFCLPGHAGCERRLSRRTGVSRPGNLTGDGLRDGRGGGNEGSGLSAVGQIQTAMQQKFTVPAK